MAQSTVWGFEVDEMEMVTPKSEVGSEGAQGGAAASETRAIPRTPQAAVDHSRFPAPNFAHIHTQVRELAARRDMAAGSTDEIPKGKDLLKLLNLDVLDEQFPMQAARLGVDVLQAKYLHRFYRGEQSVDIIRDMFQHAAFRTRETVNQARMWWPETVAMDLDTKAIRLASSRAEIRVVPENALILPYWESDAARSFDMQPQEAAMRAMSYAQMRSEVVERLDDWRQFYSRKKDVTISVEEKQFLETCSLREASLIKHIRHILLVDDSYVGSPAFLRAAEEMIQYHQMTAQVNFVTETRAEQQARIKEAITEEQRMRRVAEVISQQPRTPGKPSGPESDDELVTIEHGVSAIAATFTPRPPAQSEEGGEGVPPIPPSSSAVPVPGKLMSSVVEAPALAQLEDQAPVAESKAQPPHPEKVPLVVFRRHTAAGATVTPPKTNIETELTDRHISLEHGALKFGDRWPETINVDAPIGSAATIAFEQLKVVTVHSGSANFQQIWEGIRSVQMQIPTPKVAPGTQERGRPQSYYVPGQPASSQGIPMPPPAAPVSRVPSKSATAAEEKAPTGGAGSASIRSTSVPPTHQRAKAKRMPAQKMAEAFQTRVAKSEAIIVPQSPVPRVLPPEDLDTDAEQESRSFVYDISAVDPDKWVCYGCRHNVQEQHAEVQPTLKRCPHCGQISLMRLKSSGECLNTAQELLNRVNQQAEERGRPQRSDASGRQKGVPRSAAARAAMDLINSLMHTALPEVAQSATCAPPPPSNEQAVRAALEDRTSIVRRTFEFRKTLPELAVITSMRIEKSGTDGKWICLVEAYPEEAGVDLYSVQAGGRMWNVFPQNAVTIPDLQRVPGKEIGPPVPDAEPLIIVLSKIRSPMTIPPPIFERGMAAGARSYSEGVNLLQKWLRAEACSLIATIEAGDNGFYQVPAALKGCGTEMYALVMSRHCMAFPQDLRGRPFSAAISTEVRCVLDLGLSKLDWDASKPLPADFWNWISRAMAYHARHDFQPTPWARTPGTKTVRGTDGLILWSELKNKLIKSWPRKFRQRHLPDMNSQEGDKVMLLVVLTSEEGRFLTFHATNDPHNIIPFGIRAVQSHCGKDLDPRLMFEQITLQNYSQFFGRNSWWFHTTRWPAVWNIATYGICPSGDENIVENQQEWWKKRMTHFSSDVPGEYQHKKYHKGDFELEFDPLPIIIMDEERRERIKKAKSKGMMPWTGIFRTPLGNIVTWIEFTPARQTLMKLSSQWGIVRCEDRQLGCRGLRSDKVPNNMYQFFKKVIVFFDMDFTRMTADDDAYEEFRRTMVPLLQDSLGDTRVAELRKILADSRNFDPADEEAIKNAVDEVQGVGMMDAKKAKRKSAQDELAKSQATPRTPETVNNLEADEGILSGRIMELNREITCLEFAWGPAPQNDRKSHGLGSCLSYAPMAQHWRARSKGHGKNIIECHWCGTRYSSGWQCCLVTSCSFSHSQ